MRRHISPGARRSPYYRLVYAVMYLLLTLGAVTVLYPLALMLAQSVSSRVDMYDGRLLPRYLTDDTDLFRKYLAEKYQTRSVIILNRQYDTAYRDYRDPGEPDPVPEAFVREWLRFSAALPLDWRAAGFVMTGQRSITGETVRMFRRYVEAKYGNDPARINREYGARYASIDEILTPVEDGYTRPRCMHDDPWYRDFTAFKALLPAHMLYVITAEPEWHTFLAGHYGTPAELNRENGTAFAAFTEVPLYERAPEQPGLREAWDHFVRRICPPLYVTVDSSEAGRYRNMLHAMYGTAAAWNAAGGGTAASFSEAPFPGERHICGYPFTDWQTFIKRTGPGSIRLQTPEILFRRTLLTRYGGLDGVNRALGTTFPDTESIRPPMHAADRYEFGQQTGLRRYFFTRNYRTVWHLITRNRILLVTVVHVTGIILIQALVNVLCGYALARFRLPYTYRMLTFFLVTMAFPAEVTLLPTYLMLKEWNLLNTFWALILPGAVNGYFIFVLKGFFDHIPRPLYEAAQLDGLSEPAIFRRIALPLARPILAWLVLQSFMLAYGSFLYAMIVCQDERMWTLMVWIYELFNWQYPSVIAAATTVASLPGIIIFLFAQRLLVRGVVIPLE